MTPLMNPTVIALGGAHLVLPDTATVLSKAHWARMRAAVVLDFAGHSDAAAHVLTNLEAQLGVTSAHRQAVREGPEAVAARIRTANRRRRLDEHRRASAISVKPVVLSERVTSRMAAADAEQAKADGMRGSTDVATRRRVKDHDKAAKKYRVQAGEIAEAEREEAWRDSAIRESVQLAQLRGEVVQTEEVEMGTFQFDEDGVRLLHTKGPNKGLPVVHYDTVRRLAKSTGRSLEIALTKGWLDGERSRADSLYQAGVRYRESYECLNADHMRSSSEAIGSCGGSGFGGPKGPLLPVIHAGDTLRIMRRRLTERQLMVLDLVCGRDWRVGRVACELVAGSPSVRRALRDGLSRASRNWADACRDKETGDVPGQIERAGRRVSYLRP